MTTGELDPRPFLAALGVPAPDAVAPVTGGADTAIWRVAHGGLVSALRVFRPEQAGPARREVAALDAARAAGLPTPDVRAMEIVAGRPAMLLAWCPGLSLVDAIAADPARASELAAAWGRMQARIHAICAPAALDLTPNGWIGDAGPGEAALQARLRALPLRADALLHLDYNPGNVLTDGTDITAVIDWINVGAGDPRADCARTLVMLRLGPAPAYIPAPVVRRLRRVLEDGWRRGYEEAAGPLADMPLFYAWAGAATLDDVRGKTGRPDLANYRRRLRRWTARWKRAAGIMEP